MRPLGEGDWKVQMTPPWTPEAPGARPLRLAVAIDDEDIDFDIDHGAFPRLELVYADGTTPRGRRSPRRVERNSPTPTPAAPRLRESAR